MFCYSFIKDANLDKLSSEINSSNLSTASLNYCSSIGFNLNIYFNNSLTDDQSALLSQIVSAHSSDSAKQYIINKISSARAFGVQLMDEFGAENVLQGRTTSEVSQIASQLSAIQLLLLSGSLYTALAAIEATTPSNLLTQETLDSFAGKIKSYLGL